MANTFKNQITTSIGTSGNDIYTTPSATTTTVIGASLANKHSAAITISAVLFDSSLGVSGTTAYLVKDAPIPVGGSLVLVGGDQKVVLETGDKITVTSSVASSVDAVISVLEQS
jgi:hypothetical protein